MSYTKLFNSIITSTIWTEDDKTRILWITMLALSDKNGEVQASIPGLARVAGMSVTDCESAITKFLSPDPYSRTPDDEGRRIETIPGGWGLLNHGKYREMASREEQKEAAAERQRRCRDKQKRNAPVTQCHKLSHDVTETLHIAEADTEADTKAEKKKISCPLPDAATATPDVCDFLWKSFPQVSRTRSSMKQVRDEWKRIKVANRPTLGDLTFSLAVWNQTEKWKEGYAEGVHLWFKRRQWENTPEVEAAHQPDLLGGRTASITKASDIVRDPNFIEEEIPL